MFNGNITIFMVTMLFMGKLTIFMAMTNIAMEHGHKNNEFSHQQWWLSMVMLAYQRVNISIYYVVMMLTINVCESDIMIVTQHDTMNMNCIVTI